MTNLTTKQKLADGTGRILAIFIDESAEIKRWSPRDNGDIEIEVYPDDGD